jgi:TonB family protein
MSLTYSTGPTSFGLLPEPEGRAASFVSSVAINLAILGIVLAITMTARHVLQQHYEQVELIAPNTPPPPKPKPVAVPPVPPPPQVQVPKIQLDTQKIAMPKPKPEPKPIQMEAKVNLPVIKPKEQQVVLAPQPKAALTAAMPAQNAQVKPSTAPVHLGETFGVTPNPNASRPATVAAIGNINGGMQGPAVAPHGVVGSTGLGNGLTSGSSSGTVGKVASAGIPAASTGASTSYGKVASAGIPAAVTAAPVRMATATVQATNLEVLSKPPVQYTSEARQLKVEGDVILRVTFTANGQVQVQSVVRGLGHGLDEEARRVAAQIRFRPATKNGVPVDMTTNITIAFQMA